MDNFALGLSVNDPYIDRSVPHDSAIGLLACRPHPGVNPPLGASEVAEWFKSASPAKRTAHSAQSLSVYVLGVSQSQSS